jgi:hypothetical protein
MQVPHEEIGSEVAVALVKGAIQAVPLAGGLLAEVVNLFVNPAERRKERWLMEVSAAIEKLQKELGLIPEALQKDERFISFLYQATQIALRNHREEKIRALRNALEATAKKDIPEEDTAFQFLRFVDELSVIHLRVLGSLNKHAEQFARLGKLEQVLSQFEQYLGASIERAHFRAVIKDLESRSLILAVDVEDLPEFATGQDALLAESSGLKPLGVTSLGRSFLKFIGEGR